ncbi:uncharacterized protein LOC133315850 [Gastrolobium bilobum]|uniref:uncharacterized protein LOC133315850 n=1 Tax=Gastrolobium bilobum TaxID=150636 RepID=UPI002AB2D5A8|nr:uncharacterized protein LOC133315850 [Gastrolobium bilobum]
MAHRPTQRRNLTTPEPNTSSIGGCGSTPAKHPNPTTFTATLSHCPTPIPDFSSKPSFILKYLSSLNITPKAPPPHKLSQTNHPPQPPPPLVDTHFPMTSSSIVDSYKLSLLKPNTQITRVAPKLVKESKPTEKPSKEKKPKKSNTELERWNLEGVMRNEKKDSDGGLCSRVLFEDFKVEKLRIPLVEELDAVERNSVSLAPPSGGRRRSLCGSQVDLGYVFAVNGVKVVSADMPPFMQIHAVDFARKAFDSMEKFTSKTLAFTLKKEFDRVYGSAWHCIVGTNFGSFVTHSVGGFLYFSMDQKLYILLFKTAVQKAS